MIDCPICGKHVKELNINAHIDSSCQSFIEGEISSSPGDASTNTPSQKKHLPVSSFFQPPSARNAVEPTTSKTPKTTHIGSLSGNKRSANAIDEGQANISSPKLSTSDGEGPLKRPKTTALQRAAPLAERMRPRTLDDVCGQELVGENGVLRGLIEQDRVPSMILWGGPGSGKTTIARVIAKTVGNRFVEINSTSSGVAECKKIFAEAKSELSLTGRKTILFCDEIHRFSKTQQDVLLGPVESGLVTFIGATTENPSFKLQNALLSRCRTFTLQKLTDEDVSSILRRALSEEARQTGMDPSNRRFFPSLIDSEFIQYMSSFADGDARTALNLLDLAMDLSTRKGMSKSEMKKSLTKTLVYDRAGDQHYDTISAFHKSIRGSDPDAALYYLARMLQSGEDPKYIARRLCVVASEDIGLADNSMLSLATATYAAAERLGMPECRINLAHATVAMALSPKSTRAYRGLANAMAALQEPGIAGLPIPIHLRNAPTRLMKELGYGKEYKYNPNYREGKVQQEYLPEKLKGRQFLEDLDLGTEVDPEYVEEEEEEE
ncbi:MAG: hypothetical protein M1834_002923 [Cirrosporium novae-zelandiae]|nr:MAG: hypothetical protein M1834_002923 [Cirrosporium novae-zelandiae]